MVTSVTLVTGVTSTRPRIFSLLSSPQWTSLRPDTLPPVTICNRWWDRDDERSTHRNHFSK